MTQRLREELLFIVILAIAMLVALFVSAGYPLNVRLMPQVVATVILILLAFECLLTVRRGRATKANVALDADGARDNEPVWGSKFRRTAPYMGWLLVLYLGIHFVGFLAATAIFTIAFCRFVGKMSWRSTLIGTVLLLVALIGLSEAFNMSWPVGYFFNPFR